MKYYAGLVIAYLSCDQRCAFSENTTGTIWYVFHVKMLENVKSNCIVITKAYIVNINTK